MKDQFIPSKLEKKMVRMGFDRNKRLRITNSTDSVTGILWQQAFDWFTNKGLHSYIEGAYPWFRYYINTKDDRYEGHKYSTITEARLSCLDKLIELCQHRNEASNQ